MENYRKVRGSLMLIIGLGLIPLNATANDCLNANNAFTSGIRNTMTFVQVMEMMDPLDRANPETTASLQRRAAEAVRRGEVAKRECAAYPQLVEYLDNQLENLAALLMQTVSEDSTDP